MTRRRARRYYYRLKVTRQHALETGCPDAPFVFTECRYASTETDPDDPANPKNGTVGCTWGDDTGVINAASGHHLAEARWLRNQTYAKSYLDYFFRGATFPNGSKPSQMGARVYTAWQTHALWRSTAITGDVAYFCRVDIPPTGRGDAAAAT